jgi:hypothetical protein
MEINGSDLFNILSVNGFSAHEPEEIIHLSTGLEPLKEDLWSFGYFWDEVLERFSSVEELYEAIRDLQKEIHEIKEKYRPLSSSFPDFRIEPNLQKSISGSYFLIDEDGNKRFLIKPLDEEAGCIHSEGFTTPFTSSPVRSNMPLYLSPMREVLASIVAETIGTNAVVPKTVLGVFESDQFHDFSNGVSLGELRRYMDHCGPAQREKLCSAQEFVPNSKSLFEAIHEFQMDGLRDDEIEARFDQRNFEDANILIWATYDTDGHSGNFLVYSKGNDQIGNEMLGLKKIDNGLAFPDKNQQLRNTLSHLPNAKKELSKEGKEKILAIDASVLARQFEIMGLQSAVPALKERISILKELAIKPGITIKEINCVMSKIGNKS